MHGVCQVFPTFISRRTFLQARAELRPFECPLSPLSFIVEKGKWQAVGLNYQAHLMEDQKVWEKLPPFTFASLDPDLLKGLLVDGHGSFICEEVGNADEPEDLLQIPHKVPHCIDRLDWDSAGAYTWRRNLTRQR